MFFPKEEYPTAAVERELERLGVLCSVLPDLVPPYAVQSSNSLNDTEGKRLAGFSMKSAALLLSSFEEVRAWFLTKHLHLLTKCLGHRLPDQALALAETCPSRLLVE